MNHKLTLNGVAAPTVASSGSAASVGTLSVGDNGAAINQYDLWDGMMSEHIVFSGVFSSADQMRVQVDQKTYFGAP